MEAFLVSALAVTVGEIGDKTQLLAFILAARFKRPVPIIAGVFAATVVNHTLAGLVGEWLRTMINPQAMHWILGISFLAIAAWALIPDKVEEEDAKVRGHYGVFFVTFIAFFLAEMGDKTQLATIALAAKYPDLVAVIMGTTLGMLIADVPAVFVGHAASPKFPFKLVRMISAAIFAVLGIVTLTGAANLLP
jgi:putative Ca2+/H+ antiporter (TMEM165/GDT1 family)